MISLFVSVRRGAKILFIIGWEDGENVCVERLRGCTKKVY